MTAVDTMRVALFGSPPDPNHEPNREGVLAATVELQAGIDAAGNNAASYATVADLPVVTAADNGDQARVYDDPDAENNTYWIVRDGAWAIDSDLIASLATVVQPLVDQAEAFATAAGAVGLFPDAFFAASAAIGGGLVVNERDYLTTTQTNKVWEPHYPNGINKGAYKVASGGAIGAWRVWFDSPEAINAGIDSGDQITPIFLVKTTNGATVNVGARFIDSAGAYVGIQVGTAAATGTGQLQSVSAAAITVPVGAMGCELWCWGGASDIYVIDVDAAVGSDGGPLRRFKWQSLPLLLNAERLALNNEKADWAFTVEDEISFDGRLDSIAITLSTAVARDEASGFTGFGQSFTTPGSITTNAAYLPATSRGSTTKKWSRIDFFLRTHATTPASSSATLVAVATTRVDPESDSLSDIYALWRDPATGEIITVTESDLLAKYAIMAQAYTVGNERATMGDQLGSFTGATAETSYYVTTQNARTESWTAYFGNPTIAIAAVNLDTPVEAPEVQFTDAAKSAIGEALSSSVLPYANVGRLRRARSKRNGMKQTPAISARINIGFMTDSWGAESLYFMKRLAKALNDDLGNIGIGYFGVGFYLSGATKVYPGDAQAKYYAVYTGTWTSNYHSGSTSPNISDARSSSAGARIKIASTGGAVQPAFADVKLHFTGTADGVIKWRWGGGAWSADTNVQGGIGVQQTLSLTGFPVAALTGSSPVDTNNLEIEVVSGSVILGGVDFQPTGDGWTVYKLASAGATSTNWLASMGAQWRAGFAALNLDTVGFLTGVNDEAQSIAAGVVKNNTVSIMSNIDTATPGIDKLIIVPPECPTKSSMPAIAAAQYEASVEARAAYLNLQAAYGDADNTAEYASSGAVPFFLPDNAHPTYATAISGAARNADEIYLTLLTR